MRPQFGADLTNRQQGGGGGGGGQENNGEGNNNDNAPPVQPPPGGVLMCSRSAGKAIIRVVGRCNEAQENFNLDLSECQLMQVPDAVYHLMRHTELRGCNLSSNAITKLPPKFAAKFSLITVLNLSRNRLSRLPEEFCDLSALTKLDISHNAFISLPRVVFKIPNLTSLVATDNHITEVEVDKVVAAPTLTDLDLRRNPLSRRMHTELSALPPRIRLALPPPPPQEEWEDLSDV
ncbi:leucine-rich repeat-containing protein 20 [Hetaerina americana]|uniref:leucine-rich repeat-containing protein 20 n=1 Tax=Hetaerina americana TaxID=62018 RepID=UPI003A7F50CC